MIGGQPFIRRQKNPRDVKINLNDERRRQGKRERERPITRKAVFFYQEYIYTGVVSLETLTLLFFRDPELSTQPSSDVVIQLDLREHFSILIDPIRLVHSTLQYILKFRSGGSGSFLELTGMTKRKENARLFSSPSQLDTALAHLRHKLYKLYDLYHF